MAEKILITDLKKIYSEFGINIHSQTTQSQTNELVKEIINLRRKLYEVHISKRG